MALGEDGGENEESGEDGVMASGDDKKGEGDM